MIPQALCLQDTGMGKIMGGQITLGHTGARQCVFKTLSKLTIQGGTTKHETKNFNRSIKCGKKWLTPSCGWSCMPARMFPCGY